MEKALKTIATNYGLYLGALLALLTVLAYALDLTLMTNMWFGIFILVVVITLGIISVVKTKQALLGFATFKQAFASYFLTVLIGLVISNFVSYLLFNFIDPEAADTLKQLTIEKTIAMLEGFNTPNEIIAESVDQMESQNQYSLVNIIKSLASSLVLFTLIGLVVAAFMKKNNPAAQ